MRRSAQSGILAAAHATRTAALLIAITAASPLAAQLQLQALYPLFTDLLDVTNNNGPVSLLGSPLGPPLGPRRSSWTKSSS